MQIPHAEKGTICPLHKKDTSTVCHKCPWWTRVIGKNPQSEEMIDDWRCAVAMLPMLLIENAQVSRGSTVAMESFRNEVVSGVAAAITMNSEQRRLINAKPGNNHR
jgi:hypothetical protein